MQPPLDGTSGLPQGGNDARERTLLSATRQVQRGRSEPRTSDVFRSRKLKDDRRRGRQLRLLAPSSPTKLSTSVFGVKSADDSTQRQRPSITTANLGSFGLFACQRDQREQKHIERINGMKFRYKSERTKATSRVRHGRNQIETRGLNRYINTSNEGHAPSTLSFST